MSKQGNDETPAVKAGQYEAEKAKNSVKRERIGIFVLNWKQVKSYGPQTVNNSVKSFSAGRVIYRESELDELLAEGAPIRVYSRDAD